MPAARSTSVFFNFTRWAGLRRRRLRSSRSSSHDRARPSFSLERHNSVPHSTTRSAKYASSSVRSGLSAQLTNSVVFTRGNLAPYWLRLQGSVLNRVQVAPPLIGPNRLRPPCGNLALVPALRSSDRPPSTPRIRLPLPSRDTHSPQTIPRLWRPNDRSVCNNTAR